jgi:hypothetical protein
MVFEVRDRVDQRTTLKTSGDVDLRTDTEVTHELF